MRTKARQYVEVFYDPDLRDWDTVEIRVGHICPLAEAISMKNHTDKSINLKNQVDKSTKAGVNR